MTQRFIGIDLAWSPRNASGAAALATEPDGGTRLVASALLPGHSDPAPPDDPALLAPLLAFIREHAADEPAIVAVDAPLWVPNESGRRPGEAAITAAFQHYHAGAHPANRRLLSRGGLVRGEALVAALAAHGFAHLPTITAALPTRQVTEVFPHPAIVTIFGLSRILKYKARPGRSIGDRLREFARLQELLASLDHADPPLHGQGELLAIDVGTRKGRALKDYEDRLDALVCAYIAAYAFRWGTARCRAFGTMRGGYIFTPVPPALLLPTPPA